MKNETKNRINDLESEISYDNNLSTEEQLKNLKANYEKTNKYIEHNKERMDDSALSNIKKKQDNRENQMDQLQ
ncbi:hypothetical protein [Clostridium sp. Marseille-QA1073]